MATKGKKKATTSKAKKAAKPRASTGSSTRKRTKKAATPTRKATSPAGSAKKPAAKKANKKAAKKANKKARKKTTAARAKVSRSTKKASKGKQMTSKSTKIPKKTTTASVKKAPATKAAATPTPPAAKPAAGESTAKVSPFRSRADGSNAKKTGRRAAAAVEESPAALRAKKRARQRSMQKFRRILLDKKASLLEAYHIAKGDSQTSTSDGTEDYIDYAVSSYAREFSLSLSEMERKNLRLVEEALARLDRKTFGDCQQCGNEIPIPRLDVEPWARHCIRCQELEEQGLLEERDSEWDDEEAVSSETEARLAGEGDEESDEEEHEESN